MIFYKKLNTIPIVGETRTDTRKFITRPNALYFFFFKKKTIDFTHHVTHEIGSQTSQNSISPVFHGN